VYQYCLRIRCVHSVLSWSRAKHIQACAHSVNLCMHGDQAHIVLATCCACATEFENMHIADFLLTTLHYAQHHCHTTTIHTTNSVAADYLIKGGGMPADLLWGAESPVWTRRYSMPDGKSLPLNTEVYTVSLFSYSYIPQILL
jgi:hypothetical protein